MQTGRIKYSNSWIIYYRHINGFIDREKQMESAKAYGKSPYGEHLKAVAEGKVRY